MRRCAIVGISAVTSLGQTVQETFNNIRYGKTGIKPIEHISTKGCYSNLGAEIPEVDIANTILSTYYPAKLSTGGNSNKVVYSKYNSDTNNIFLDSCRPNKYYHILGKALQDALSDANISTKQIDSINDVFINATCSGDSDYATLVNETSEGIEPRFGIHLDTMEALLPVTMSGSTDNSITISTACSSGTTALSFASNLIKSHYRRAIVMGADIISDIHFAGFTSLKSLDTEPCKPFSKPNGLTLGDGAAVLILEEEEFAKSRNAKIYGYIDGSAVGIEACHITSPDETGESQSYVMKQAISDANITPDDIDFVYAHGTGTVKNDTAESLAILKTFEKDSAKPYVGSSKSAIGHTLGASGLINAALSVKMIEEGCILPTVGFTGKGIVDGINYKNENATVMYPNNILCNSFAFGGNDASIVISKKPHSIKEFNPYQESSCYILGFNSLTCEFTNNNIKIDKDIYNTLGMDLNNVRKMDGYSRIKCISGIRALEDAKIMVTKENCHRIGILGTSTIGTPTMCYEGQIKPLVEKGNGWGDSILFPNSVENAGDGWLSISTGIKGYSLSILCNIETQLAYKYASFLINEGYLDIVLISNCNAVDTTLECSSLVIGKSRFLPKDSYLRIKNFDTFMRDTFSIRELVSDVLPYTKSKAAIMEIL